MKLFHRNRREYTSDFLADLAKATFGLAIASKLFHDFPLWARVALLICGALFYFVGLWLKPKPLKGEEE
jgi:hypothetical protein